MNPGSRLAPRQWLFDILIASGLLALGLIGKVEIGETSIPFVREPDFLHGVLVGLMTLPLALRRVYTVPVFVVVLLAWVVDRGLDYPGTPADIGVAVAFYTLGAMLDRRRSLRLGGASALLVVGWTALGAAVLESVTVIAVLTTLIFTVTPLLLGREVHERRRLIEELENRAAHAEQEREERARQAVADERGRIARELHDVVAHQMTVMTLQAEGAKRIAEDADPRVSEALETIRQAGHEALAEMRRTVGLLRTSEDDAETKPLPRLTDLDELVEQIKAAGVPVEMNIRGRERALSDGAELSAYRIVQESLTNALRHGGPDVSAEVSIEYGEDALNVSVSDDGRGSASATPENGGHGLIGMKERVAVLGGHFDAGPRSGGGFAVRATIPIER